MTQPRGPPLPPILAIERTDFPIQLFLPGDWLKAVDHELFQCGEVGWRGGANCDFHSHILATRSQRDLSAVKLTKNGPTGSSSGVQLCRQKPPETTIL